MMPHVAALLSHQLRKARPGACAVLAGAVLLACPQPARAQYIERYFQPGVPGYGSEAGVTVLSRQRPLYQEHGVQVGSFNIRPNLDEALSYNSNVDGVSNSPGSWIVATAPSITVGSTWSRNALGGGVTLHDYRYLDTPRQNHTDWTASLRGAYTIGSGYLTANYSLLALHQIATELGALPSTSAVPYTVDDFRSNYTFDLGRVSVTPNVEDRIYNFGSATINGQTVDQGYRDRNVLIGGVTTRYELSKQRHLLLVLHGIDTHYLKHTAGQLDNNSTGFLFLAGIDYQTSSVWRYRLLAGVEVRAFAARQFGTQTAPIAEGSVIWTPTGLTTVTATLSRAIEDPATENTGSYTFTTSDLVVDHELRRNVLLQGRARFQLAQYLNAGTQTSFSLGGRVTWLLNRNLRLSVDYAYTQQSGPTVVAPIGPGGLTTPLGGTFRQNVVMLTLHVAP